MSNLVGSEFGRLKVLSADAVKSAAGHKYYICMCSCGNTVSVRSDRLKSGTTKSCGCLNREKSAQRCRDRADDLTGQTVGNLKVIRYDHSDKQKYYLCECKLCGNKTVLPATLIRRYNSCGCLSAKSAQENMYEASAERKKLMTNIELVIKTEANSNNKLGVRGVFFKKSAGKYEAYIYFRKTRKFLGLFDTLEEAAEARKAGERARDAALADLLEFEAALEAENMKE